MLAIATFKLGLQTLACGKTGYKVSRALGTTPLTVEFPTQTLK